MTATPATQVQHDDHCNALGGKVLQKPRVLAVAPAQTATCPAVAPKLRQNRFKYSATAVHKSMLLPEVKILFPSGLKET
jgi:hypothetical protein